MLLAGSALPVQLRAQRVAPAAREAAPGAARRLARLDVLLARSTAVHSGVGAGVAAGTYVRLEATVGAGAVVAGGATHGSARVDLAGRFLLDPYAETRWGPYGGAGLTVRKDGGDPNAHAFLLALFGVEGPRRGSVYPAAEVGLGGGVRLGVVLRTAPAGRR